MTWFLVWTLLALAALAVLGLLGLRLWRGVTALGREVAEAGRLAERLGAVAEPAPLASAVPGVTGHEATVDAARTAGAELRTRRAVRRGVRLASATARWRDHGLL